MALQVFPTLSMKEILTTVVMKYRWLQPLVKHKAETVSPGECIILWKWIQSNTQSYRMDIDVLAKLQPSAPDF